MKIQKEFKGVDENQMKLSAAIMGLWSYLAKCTEVVM